MAARTTGTPSTASASTGTTPRRKVVRRLDRRPLPSPRTRQGRSSSTNEDGGPSPQSAESPCPTSPAHTRSKSGSRTPRHQGPTATTKLRFDNVRPGESPAPDLGLDRPSRDSIRGTPQPSRRPTADLRHQGLRRLGRLEAGRRPVRRGGSMRGRRDRPARRVQRRLADGRRPARRDGLHPRGGRVGSGMKSAQFVETTVVHVDTTMPVTRLAGLPAGWTNRPVTLTATATDATSGMRPWDQRRVHGDPGRWRGANHRSGNSVERGGDRRGRPQHRLLRPRRGRQHRRRWPSNGDGCTAAPSTAMVRIDRNEPAASFLNLPEPRGSRS